MATEVELFEYFDIPTRERIRGIIDTSGYASITLGGRPVAAFQQDSSGNVTGLVAPGGGVIGFPSSIQIGVPFAVQSGGTVGNNGALSGIVALPYAYTAIYMYFPALAISATSAAGWYFVVMSSLTAGTIYNNTYVSGTPTVPTTPVPFATTGSGAYTQLSGVSITGPSLTIPAGALGAHGSIRISKMGSCTNGANNKRTETFMGGSSFVSVTYTTINAYRTIEEISNLSVSSQIGSYYTLVGTAPADWLRRTVDTSVAQTLNLTLQVFNAVTDFMVLESSRVEIFYSA